MPTIGWMISTNGQRNLRGGNNGLAISFIRPFATDKDLYQNTPPEDLEGIFQTDEAEASAADILRNGRFLVNPWLHLKHGETEWRLYYKFEVGGFDNYKYTFSSRSGIEEARVNPAQRELILERINQELEELTVDMKQALSSHPDKLEEDKKGFVHAMAPLSQLPPVISNEVLRFGHIIDFDENFCVGEDPATGSYVDQEVVFIAVPNIVINGTLHEPDRIQPLAFTGNGLPDMAIVEYPTLKVQTGAINRDFAIIVECTRIQKPVSALVAGDAQSDRRKRDVVSILGGLLSPIRIAADIIHSDDNLGAQFQESWIPYLLNALGNGWLVEDTDTPFDDHVFTVVQKELDCKRLLGLNADEKIDIVLPKSGWTYKQGQQIFKADFQNPGSTELRDTAEFWLGIAYLMTHLGSASNEQLVETWGRLADMLRDSAKAANLIKDWLGYLLMKFAREDKKEFVRKELLPEIETVVTEQTAAECRLRSLELTCGLDSNTRQSIIAEVSSTPDQEFPDTVNYLKSQLTIFQFKNKQLTAENPKPGDQIGEAVKAVAEEASLTVNENHVPKPIARDDGLPIRIDSEIPNADDQIERDRQIRGYAVALRCEIRSDNKGNELVSQEWVTNTQIACRHKEGAFVISDVNGIASTGIFAIGSAEINGMRVTEAIYDGAPLCSIPGRHEMDADPASLTPIKHIGWKSEEADFDKDNTASLDFGWYKELGDSLQHVPLGFGLSYASVGTAILNNGIVEQPEYRIPDFEASLLPASEIENIHGRREPWGEFQVYLSNEAIGEPQLVSVALKSKKNYDLRWADGQSLTSETKASELLGGQTPVTLLVPENEEVYEKGLTEIAFEFETPLPSPAFIERWLTTDEELKKKGLVTMIADENLVGGDVDIAAFRQDLLARIEAVALDEIKSSDDIDHRYHPAVDCVAFSARWYKLDLKKPIYERTEVVPISRSQWDDLGKLGPTRREDLRKLLRLSVRSTDHSVSDQERADALTNSSNRSVLLSPGEIVEVFASSCVDAKVFENENGDLPRYGQSVSKGKAKIMDNAIERFMFDGKSYWFECAPRWDEVVVLKDSWLKIEVPTLERPGLARVLLDARGDFPAEHVVGGRADRHEWHWTGAPVDFSVVDGKLTSGWLAAMAGVGSFRNNKTIVLAEIVKSGSASEGWRIKDGQALESIARSGTNSSSILAYTFRPEPRFSAWIDSRNSKIQELRSQVIATGALLRGADPTERLESPAARWIIPMTEGYERQSAREATLPNRGRNGALMVFDHVLMRTDERSQFSGVGETIDVEVVETRRLPNFDWANKELGPNPIFHASPERTGGFRQTGITASRPFGLTFDKGSNPKVVQTAISVFPEGAEGNWTLAKLRTRRMLEPETLLSYDKPNQLRGNNNEWIVGLRTEGEDSIPKDVYIEMKAKDWPTISDPAKRSELKINGKPILLPEKPSNISDEQRLRLRITWHKDRWGTPNPPEWRPRIDVQIRETDRLEWKMASVASAYSEKVAELAWNPRLDEVAKYELEFPPNVGTARWGFLNISDYSEGRWVSFVGMFGKEILDRADQYVLEARKNAGLIEIELKGEKLPILQSASQSVTGNGSPVFNLLNIYRPTTKVMQGKASETSGEFIGSLPYHGDSLFKGRLNVSELAGCIAYIMSYQHITALAKFDSDDKKNEGQELLEHGETLVGVERLVFPDFDPYRGLNQRESILRPVPQFLGPIRIIAGDDNQ